MTFTNLYLPIAGDVNSDGLTNQLDLNTVIGNFGACRHVCSG